MQEIEGIPFSVFSGKVHRHDITALGVLQDLFLECFFKEFNRFNRARRFSGDILSLFGRRPCDLPRKRYFAVCGPNGTDDGLLRNELSAYLNRAENGQVLLVNQDDKDERRIFGLHAQSGGILCILADAALSTFLKWISETEIRVEEKDRLQRHLKNAEPPTVHLKTEILDCSVSKCIDLRQPRVREWLFNRYRIGVKGWPGYGLDAGKVQGKPLKDGGTVRTGFQQMLPALLDQIVGGSVASQVIGADLRRIGAEALIYPSARSDTFVIMQDGLMTDWFGWNLVDYRGAGMPVVPTDVGMQFISEGQSELQHELQKSAEKLRASEWKLKGDYKGWDELLADVELLRRHAETHSDDGPKLVIHNIDDFWLPPKAPAIRIQHPETGQNAGSFVIAGIEVTLRNKIIEFSKYRTSK